MFTPHENAEFGRELEDLPAHEVIRAVGDRFGTRAVVLTSFQLEGLVILDLARQVDARMRVVTIDTGRLHPESYEFIDRIRDEFDLALTVLAPHDRSLEQMTGNHGLNLFRGNQELRELCCQVRKVDPLRRISSEIDAQISGLRRDGGPARAQTPVAHYDPAQQLLRINPLAAWTRAEVLAYTSEHELPIHPLHSQGFATIGCQPCTRPVAPGEGERSGRWWWESDDRRECGLHQSAPPERSEDLSGAPVPSPTRPLPPPPRQPAPKQPALREPALKQQTAAVSPAPS